jgi:outer membrane immunogenic protein
MKNFLAIGVALFALATIGTANAADLPPAPVYTKAPPRAAPYSWAGFYVGGNIGYGWGSARDDVTFFDPNVGATPVTAASSATDKLLGIIGGGQLGYNWQFLPHGVLGLEADWQGSGEKGSRSFVDSFILAPPPNSDTVAANYEAKISWFGTVRGRIGYAQDGLLFYGTAGLAYGEVKLAGTVTETFNDVGGGGPITSGTTPFGVSKVNAGWTVGGGIEGALANNWTWKIEYLYLDLGSIAGASPAGAFLAPFNGTISEQSRFTDNILRLGLNFRFN